MLQVKAEPSFGPKYSNTKTKELSNFSIIGTSQKNVDLKKIITGQPLFSIDYQVPGMLIAMIVHPPAFGMRFKSLDASSVKSMPVIKDTFNLKMMKRK